MTFSSGLVKLLFSIIIYRLMVEQLEVIWRYRLFTLILLITPLFLFLTLKKLSSRYWENKLPVARTMLTGFLFTVSAGLCIGIIDYYIIILAVPGFDSSHSQNFNTPLIPFLFNYLSWYAFIGLIATPLVYITLRWQIQTKGLNNKSREGKQ